VRIRLEQGRVGADARGYQINPAGRAMLAEVGPDGSLRVVADDGDMLPTLVTTSWA
jgi:hypothetical protein